MGVAGVPAVTVVQPGTGEQVNIPPGFGAVFKLYSRDTGGAVSIAENRRRLTRPDGRDHHSWRLRGLLPRARRLVRCQRSRTGARRLPRQSPIRVAK